MCRCEVHPPAGRAGAEGEEIMTLLTAAECREIADRKMLEAEGDRLRGEEFRATAQAWLVLAEYEGENMLVIHPDECIDCGVCVPECPVDAIKPDTEPGLEKWLSLNAEYAKIWPNITVKKAPPRL